MTTVAAAFPFIRVQIDTSALQPVAQRSPGVLAVVGTTPAGAAGGSAAVNVPVQVVTPDDAAQAFSVVTDGVAASNSLHDGLILALGQNPPPSKIYGVRVDGTSVAAALAGLEAADDVTFVVLAGVTDVGTAATPADAATGLLALKSHVETMSAAGNKRMGVAAIDSTKPRSATYVAEVVATAAPLKSDVSRMILVAARGATGDVGVAAAAAIAGLAPSISTVLKRVQGFSIPVASQYGPSEILQLSEAGIVPIIDSAVIVGESLNFADGRTFTTDASQLFIDTVRTLDDIDFRLKAGLIGLVGDARITKSGLTLIKARIEGILGPLERTKVIDGFSVQIPVLDILSIPRTSWQPADETIVTTARANRAVGVALTVILGPATHQIDIQLAPSF